MRERRRYGVMDSWHGDREPSPQRDEVDVWHAFVMYGASDSKFAAWSRYSQACNAVNATREIADAWITCGK